MIKNMIKKGQVSNVLKIISLRREEKKLKKSVLSMARQELYKRSVNASRLREARCLSLSSPPLELLGRGDSCEPDKYLNILLSSEAVCITEPWRFHKPS